MSYDIECPYCGKGQEINHDDGFGYAEDELHVQQCGDCEQYFTFTTSILFCYSANVADCLNGEEHDFKATITHPKMYTRMQCADCEKERKLTEQEWFDLLRPMETISSL